MTKTELICAVLATAIIVATSTYSYVTYTDCQKSNGVPVRGFIGWNCISK